MSATTTGQRSPSRSRTSRPAADTPIPCWFAARSANPRRPGFFLAHAPEPTPVPELIAVAGMRWKIEENNEQGKDLLGLNEYQVRKWVPSHRHVTCPMLAHAFLAVTRAQLGKEHPLQESPAC